MKLKTTCKYCGKPIDKGVSKLYHNDCLWKMAKIWNKKAKELTK